jgi:hypothetical protein
MRRSDGYRVFVIVALLALPFCIGYVAAQYTGRPSRLFTRPTFFIEAVAGFAFVLVVQIKRGRVIAERYGVRKTYTRSGSPIGYWSVIGLESAVLARFGYLMWGSLSDLLR